MAYPGIRPTTLTAIAAALETTPEKAPSRMSQMYRDGHTLQSLADCTGVSINTVWRILEAQGVERRRTAEGKTAAITRRIEEQEGKDIKTLLHEQYVDQGLSAITLSIRFGISETAMRTQLYQYGFIVRNPEEAANNRYARERRERS